LRAAFAPSADVNDALCSSLIVSSNEAKCVADVETAFDDLPHVVCNVNELNQVFLNLIVNVKRAIANAAKDGRRGTIRIATTSALDDAIVTISDDGPGSSDEIRTRISDPSSRAGNQTRHGPRPGHLALDRRGPARRLAQRRYPPGRGRPVHHPPAAPAGGPLTQVNCMSSLKLASRPGSYRSVRPCRARMAVAIGVP
jgi:hypothetical protein